MQAAVVTGFSISLDFLERATQSRGAIADHLDGHFGCQVGPRVKRRRRATAMNSGPYMGPSGRVSRRSTGDRGL